MNKKQKIAFCSLALVGVTTCVVVIAQQGYLKAGQGQNEECVHDLRHHDKLATSYDNDGNFVMGHKEYWACCKCHHGYADANASKDLGDVQGDRYYIDTVGLNLHSTKVKDNYYLYDLIKDSDHIIIGRKDEYSKEVEGFSSFSCGNNTIKDKVTCYQGEVDDESYSYILSDHDFCLNDNDFTTTNSFCNLFAKTIKFSFVDTSYMTSLASFFSNNANLEEIDISCFDTSNNDNFHLMFSKNPSLKTIYTSDKFVIKDGANDTLMFSDCSTNLKGQNGTVWDSDHVDGEYARIDKTATPGYFSKVTEPTFYNLSFNITGSNTCSVMESAYPEGDIVIPRTVDGSKCNGTPFKNYRVTSIPEAGFYLNVSITKVVLPDTLESIERLAFAQCSNLESINFPKSIKHIASEAFGECNKIKIFDFSKTQITTLSQQLFVVDDTETDVAVEHVYLPNTLETIDDYAFEWCGNLKDITIPKSVTSIGGSAFVGSYDIEEVIVDSPTIAVMDNPGCLFSTRWSPKKKVVKVPKGTVVGSTLSTSYSKTSDTDYDIYTQN